MPAASERPAADAAAVGRVLRALQVGDSMFPVGAFSFSCGVESALAEHAVSDADTLREWVRAATRVAAAGDGIALLHTYRAIVRGAPGGAVQADEAVYRRKLNEEMRVMTLRTGRKLAEAAACVAPGPVTADWLDRIRAGRTRGTYPAGLGVCCAQLGLAETDAFAMHQYAVAATMISAAVRLMPLHHLTAQTVLRQVGEHAAADYAAAASRTLADMSGFAPQADILASVHVRSHVRMFMS